MKKKLKKNLIAIAILSASTNCFAQIFEITPATSMEFGRTEIPIRGVGVGYFPSGTITNSALHINTNYIGISSNYPGIDFGEVFRTDAPNGATYWKMFRNGIEIGRYWNNGTDNELNLGTIQTNTNPNLNLYAGNSQRMTISGINGFIGIGAAITNPAFQLEVADDINITTGIFPGAGYRWNDEVILKTNIVGANIFLGYNAGNNVISGLHTFVGVNAGNMHSGTNDGNTVIGNNAGSLGSNYGESVFVGISSGMNNNGNNNTFVGPLSGVGLALNNSSGNSFLGHGSGRDNTGNNNTFIGMLSGRVNTVNNNTFIGFSSGTNNSTGRGNLFAGANSGLVNSTGSDLTFLGFNAGSNNQADNNSFVGSSSGAANTTGFSNSFFGSQSGLANDRGKQNSFIGHNAGLNNVDGNDNAFVGFNSGVANVLGLDNSYYGSMSGKALNGGDRNTLIGSNAGSVINAGNSLTFLGAGTTGIDGLTNATAIGASADVRVDKTMILGDNTVKVGIGLSGDPLGPQNKLEINAGTNNLSGLRFTKLTSNSPANVFGVVKVLTVDGFGDVILGEIPGSGGTINACAGGLNNTDFITKISNANEICRTAGIYELPGLPNTVGIGVGSAVNTGPANNFKLDLKGDLYIRHDFTNNIGGDIWMNDHFNIRRPVFTMYGLNGFGTIAIGPNSGSNNQFTSTLADNNVYVGLNTGMLTADTRNNTFVGFRTGINYTGTPTDGYNTLLGSNIGVAFIGGDFNTFVGDNSGGVTSGSDNVMLGQTTSITNSAGGISMTGDRNIILGAKAHLMGGIGITNITNSVSLGYSNRVMASNFIGMGFQVNPGVTEQQIGMGYVVPPSPGILAGTLAKLYVQSYGGGPTAAFFNGNIYTNTVMYPSDSALKDNITPFTDATFIISQLEAKSYEFKNAAYPGLTLPIGNQIGFLAEDIKMVLPDLVKPLSSPAVFDSNGNVLHPQIDFEAVNYTGLIPVLFTAIKQQQEQLDSLALVVSSCCASPIIDPTQSNRASISLSNNEAIVLNQNTPNPFADKTEISYNIPKTVQSAIIMFYDQGGKILQQHEISHRGAGSLTVYSEDLTSGIYSYTLIIDGKNHQIKRMMKQ